MHVVLREIMECGGSTSFLKLPCLPPAATSSQVKGKEKQCRVTARHLDFFVALGIICLTFLPLQAQYREPRIMELDVQMKYAEALAMCEKSDDLPAAMYFAGDYYFHGRKGIPQDQEKGKTYYLKALNMLLPLAEGKDGDALAQYRAARCLEFGKKDMLGAAAWYAYAAEGGNAKAMTRLALLEKGVKTPYQEVMDYLKRASELGDVDAKAWQGAMLVEHKETQEEGVKLLREAAKEGSPVALARLSALCYLGEGGVEKNVELAVDLLQAAVDRGFSEGIDPLEKYRANLPPPPPWKPEGAPPGFGFPGRLIPYEPVTDKLRANLEKFGMRAGWFVRDPIPPSAIPPEKCPDRLPWLLHAPAPSRRPVPMVIYFGGTGEQGTDLMAHFRQTVVFSEVTAPAFQQKRPCYLFAPMLPTDYYDIMPYAPGEPPHLTALICDAMYAVIRTLNNPPVDTNRLYVTGLSRGGHVSFALLSGYPGRFAAAIPTSTFQSPSLIPADRPGDYWLFLNEGDYGRKGMKETLDKTIEVVESRGGEFRLSTYPQGGHDAWSKAWREDAAWDWMFSKSLRRPPAGAAAPARAPTPVCTASIPGKDAKTGPQYGADGLDGTSYVSAKPMSRGDWWMAEYPRPVSGKFTVETGAPGGKGALSAGRVEVSADGATWHPAGGFNNGACRFELRAGVRFLRVLPEPATPETLTLRKVTVAP